MASNASKSPTGNATNGGLKKRKTVTQEKKIADDEFMAAAIGDVEWLKQSMRANRGAVTFDKNGLAPIHLAAIHGRVECLKVLVEKFKVDCNLGSTTGWRPAHLCISNQTGKRAYQCLAYLLEKAADPSVANDDGITPMHQAASEGHVQCLKALIDAGGNVKGVDRRGHTPIDLAKLWGHRKCARMLAAERWQQEKEFVAKEMKQLQKVQMQKALEQISEDDEHKKNQAFFGEQAFNEWLNTRGLDKASTGPPAHREPLWKPPKPKTKGKEEEPKESLHKANSLRPPPQPRGKPSPIKEEPERRWGATPTDGFRTPFTRSTNEEGREQINVNLSDKSQSEKQPEKEDNLWYNPNEWNKSTHVPKKQYEPILPDHYPHDEYTMKPKFPPERETHRRNEPLRQKAGGPRMPDLPKDLIEKKMNPAKYERPVVYKCKHIADIHKKHHYDNEALPRQEAGLHLTDDLESLVFRAALQTRRPRSVPHNGHKLSGTSATKSDFSLEKVDSGVVNIMKRIQQPNVYPHIMGPHYDLLMG